MQPEFPAAPDPLSIFILARSLDVGGTERQLVELAAGLHERGYSVRVGLFYSGGILAHELAGRGVEIVDLGKRGRWDVLRFLRNLIRAVRVAKPDVIYSFLGGANAAAAVVKPFVTKSKLVWSVRNSSRDLSVSNVAAAIGYCLETSLARYADEIIANSVAGRAFAIDRGFPVEKISVVPNGIDTIRFRPDSAVRAEQRRNLGISDDDLLVGVLGRLNLAKDHATFLRSAAIVAQRRPRTRFVCVGDGPERRRLEHLAADLGINDRVLFPGELDPVSALNSFDIACSPSITEGFSNAIGEAMSCGLPCVVTDAGDSAAIVGELGCVVPKSSPAAFANAIESQIERLPTWNPSAPRVRIVENFSMSAMIERTLKLLHGREISSAYPAAESQAQI